MDKAKGLPTYWSEVLKCHLVTNNCVHIAKLQDGCSSVVEHYAVA